MHTNYRIDFWWDDEVNVWIATSEDDDISGLVLEHDTFEGLVDEVKQCIPVLLECQQMVRDNVSLDFVAHRQERLARVG